jgi:hypothetical protein
VATARLIYLEPDVYRPAAAPVAQDEGAGAER